MNRKGRKVIHGICFICGEKSKLTFEHIPPKICNNNQQLKLYNIFDFESKKVNKLKTDAKYKQIRAMGKHCLCSKCNNKMGIETVKKFKKYYFLDNLEVYMDENKKKIYVKYDKDSYKGFVKQCVFMISAITQEHDGQLPKEILEVLSENKNKNSNIRYKVAINEIPLIRKTGLTATMSGSNRFYVNSILDFYFWKIILQKEGEIDGMDLHNPEIIDGYLKIPIFKNFTQFHAFDMKE